MKGNKIGAPGTSVGPHHARNPAKEFPNMQVNTDQASTQGQQSSSFTATETNMELNSQNYSLLEEQLPSGLSRTTAGGGGPSPGALQASPRGLNLQANLSCVLPLSLWPN